MTLEDLAVGSLALFIFIAWFAVLSIPFAIIALCFKMIFVW